MRTLLRLAHRRSKEGARATERRNEAMEDFVQNVETLCTSLNCIMDHLELERV